VKSSYSNAHEELFPKEILAVGSVKSNEVSEKGGLLFS
jgi:hypothetical protein